MAKANRIEYRGYLISQTKKGCYIGQMLNGIFVKNSSTKFDDIAQAKWAIDTHLKTAKA